MSTKEIYEIGEVPPVGHVPSHMYAQLIRAERFGEPIMMSPAAAPVQIEHHFPSAWF